jgi:hypothetical protein
MNINYRLAIPVINLENEILTAYSLLYFSQVVIKCGYFSSMKILHFSILCVRQHYYCFVNRTVYIMITICCALITAVALC